jgi:bifunctional non-homologous end joining protein LigD
VVSGDSGTRSTCTEGPCWRAGLEPKLDGYRFQIVKDDRAVRLHSKSGSDWTKRLLLLAEALAAIRCQSAVLDCELVFPTSEGHPDFRALQAAIGDRTRHHQLAVFAFDLLHYDGIDFKPVPLIERRLQLTELVARTQVRCLHLVQGFDNGAKLFKAAEQHDLEGIVSKRQASAYRSGPSRDWVKIKTAGWRAANRERWRLFEKR